MVIPLLAVRLLQPTGFDLAAVVDRDLQVLDSVIALLRDHFHFCNSINLVLKTFPDPNMISVAPLPDDEKIIKFLEGELLPRTDNLYREMVRHQPSLKLDGDRRTTLSFLPSLRAFTLFEAKARLRGEFMREGDWDRNQDAETALWRAMEDPDAIETEHKGTKGYWVKPDVFDMFPWEGMIFV